MYLRLCRIDVTVGAFEETAQLAGGSATRPSTEDECRARDRQVGWALPERANSHRVGEAHHWPITVGTFLGVEGG